MLDKLDLKHEVEGERPSVLIVGGGVAGLYAGTRLAKDFTVTIIDARSEFGGRIETGDVKGLRDDSDQLLAPIVKIEYGPMRFELEVQPLLKDLLKGLEIDTGRFSPPGAPPLPVSYPLLRDERDANTNPLDAYQLFKLGILRLFGRAPRVAERAVVLDDADQLWLDSLRDETPEEEWGRLTSSAMPQPPSYEYLSQTTQLKRPDALPDVLLRDVSLWHGLRQVLSPGAVDLIKNHGPFYSLLPENPSAVEWGIFWLRMFQLKPNAYLSTIPRGVRCITEGLVRRLEALKVSLRSGCIAVALRGDGDKTYVDTVDASGRADRLAADHVILALPKQPLLSLGGGFPLAVRSALDDVIAFPLLKAFLVMKWPESWKPKPPPAQLNAWLLPTREIHYLRAPTTESDFEEANKDRPTKNAIVLLYTDRPASEYWRPYVTVAGHDHAQVDTDTALKRELVDQFVMVERRRALGELMQTGPVPRVDPQAVTERSFEPMLFAQLAKLALAAKEAYGELSDDTRRAITAFVGLADWAQSILGDKDFASRVWMSVSSFGIRDWSQLPFGAGCHAWRTGVDSSDTRRRLRAFSLVGEHRNDIHICGEAFSDYQGFIEGSLRSAALVVMQIQQAYASGPS